MTCPQVIDRLDTRCACGHSNWPDTTCHYYPRGWYAQRCARVSPPRCEPESRWCEVANRSRNSKSSPARLDGPTRWRVLQSERWVGTHTDRDAAFAQAKHWRQIYGTVMRVVRTTTVSRRWRVNGVDCRVFRGWCSRRWFWAAGEVDNVFDDDGVTYAEAVEAAERAARGQR